MKRFILIISLILTVFSLSAQPPGKHHKKDFHGKGHYEAQHKPHKAHKTHKPAKPHKGHGKMVPPEVVCKGDWQELWNGRHVRLLNDKVYICDADGDRLLWGDEVILLSSGNYMVRSGDYWRIYRHDGDRTSIYGNEILCWENGTYCVRLSEMWRVYDAAGDRVGNVWSQDYIELLPNGYYLYVMSDRYYVADDRGERVFNVWGDSVELMKNGLFRCRRNGRYYYYDAAGNERN